MSSETETQLIQCPSCNSKLRVGSNARGKTIACPKCSQQIKVSDNAQAARPLVVARPVASPAPVQPTPIHASQNTGNNWGAAQLPTANVPYQPYAAKPAASSPNRMWLWIALGSVGGLVLISGSVGLLLALLSNRATKNNSNQTATNIPAGAPSTLPTGPGASNVPQVKPSLPATSPRRAGQLPELGPDFPFGQNITLHRVTIPRDGLRPLMINVFIPKGAHGNQSLPVMFESPSGTNLLHGADVNFPNPRSEILPFTEAGMITVTFSIDGSMPDSLTPGTPIYFRRLEKAYKEFVQADAGVASGKLAVDFILDKVPAADPKRLYIWGHSSSATLALLMASKDSRIAKCIALAPITDLNKRLGELATDRSMQKMLPNLDEYFKSGSPITHVSQLKCPVLVVHAKDDDNEPFPNTQAYADALSQAGGKLKFEALPSGGHYQELLQPGLQMAVEWLR